MNKRKIIRINEIEMDVEMVVKKCDKRISVKEKKDNEEIMEK